MMRFQFTAVVALGLLGATAAMAQGGPMGFPPAKVEVAMAELRELAPVVEIPGTVISKNNARPRCAAC